MSHHVPAARAQADLSRPAFTLVELLVVIAIIGILIALLLPAVQAARDSARRTACMNNVRQVAIACHLYHDAHSQFPPGYGYFRFGYSSGRAEEPEWPWVPRLFPYLEEGQRLGPIDWSWNPGWPWQSPFGDHRDIMAVQLSVFLCPSDATAQSTWNGDGTCSGSSELNIPYEYGRTTYAANLGFGQMEDTNVDPRRPRRFPGVFGYNRGLSIAQILDGAAQTLLTAELVPGGSCTIRGAIAYDEGPVFMVNRTPNDPTPDLVRWCDAADALPTAKAPCLRSAGGNCCSLSKLNMVLHTSRSFHPGGVVTSRCDGSVRFVADSVSLDTWRALGIPDDGQLPGSF